MVSPNVNKILEVADTLNDAERDELRRLLDERAAREVLRSEHDQLGRLLLERGVISSIRPKRTMADVARFDAWNPVPISGKPLSETIVEERR